MPAEPRKGISDPLDDEEDEADDPPESGRGSQLQTAVVQMSKILQRMTRDRKATNLEDVLDRADGRLDVGASSSTGRSKAAAYQRLKTLLRTSPSKVSRSIEACMQEDFNLAQSGPGLEVRACTARAWVEHRSLLQSYNGPRVGEGDGSPWDREPGSGCSGRRVVVARFRNSSRTQPSFRSVQPTQGLGHLREPPDETARP